MEFTLGILEWFQRGFYVIELFKTSQWNHSLSLIRALCPWYELVAVELWRLLHLSATSIDIKGSQITFVKHDHPWIFVISKVSQSRSKMKDVPEKVFKFANANLGLGRGWIKTIISLNRRNLHLDFTYPYFEVNKIKCYRRSNNQVCGNQRIWLSVSAWDNVWIESTYIINPQIFNSNLTSSELKRAKIVSMKLVSKKVEV